METSYIWYMTGIAVPIGGFPKLPAFLFLTDLLYSSSMKLEDIQARIKQHLKEARVEVNDMGGGDHIHAIVVSPSFEGKSLIEQHRMVLSVFQKELDSNDIHALQLKTYTPEKANAEGIEVDREN